MRSDEFRACIHPREYPRFLLALLFALPITLALLAVVVVTFGLALAYVLLLAFLVWFGFEIFYAHFLANCILVSEHNYPRLNALLEESKQTIGVDKRVDIFVYQQGEFNAYFSMLFARRAIFINSELLEQGVTDDELRWIIGRFVGRIRAKQRMGPLSWIIALAERLMIFNLFIYPYIRATAYTGDRVALAAIGGDISTAVSAMNKLMVGRQLGYSVNPAGIVMQYKRVKGSLFAFLARLSLPLPHTLARYFDLITFAERRFPAAFDQFAAMNPSFQTAGGTWRLMRSAETSHAGGGLSAGAVGALLLIGFVGTGAAGAGLLATVGYGGMSSLLPGSGYLDQTYYPIEETSPSLSEPYTDPYVTVEAPVEPYSSEAGAPEVYETYAAYAISESTLTWGAAWNAASQAEAESTAVSTCGYADCRSVLYVRNSCAAIAISPDGAWAADGGATAAEASVNALAACRNYGGASCQVQNATCSTQ
ncbi:MAG TPA: DUF4189 domain-containing protein [Vitreimonas sp.]|uniref:DUF4189 domain-containing protein n=1 Tax=Vitreimonas sp. TaxID=3069702 RepID=UPI002D6DF985|nr:DUF4189 domain-containing protein [Vitreimonas sp.]HYD87305.1 DUF4189 domain-containing protein [Vitreimonas sp.]